MNELLKAKVNDLQFDIELNPNNSATINGKEQPYDLLATGENTWHLLLNKKSYNIVLVRQEGKNVFLKVNNRPYTVALNTRLDLLLESMGMADMGKSKVNELKAPMPGLVLEIMAETGAAVKKGDALLILEAMKMENVIKSPADGVVKSISAEKGKTVEKNQLLISFE
jgi:biotin carboxyl carrier protein